MTQMTASEPALPSLPKMKTRRKKKLKPRDTFAEIIRNLGQEEVEFDGESSPQREVLVRMMYKALLNGELEFPDGRKLPLDWNEWSTMAWDLINHLDVKTVTETVRQNGALVGSALMTNVVLYLPQNGRESDEAGAQVVYADRAARDIVDLFPPVKEEVEHQIDDLPGALDTISGAHPSKNSPGRIS